MKNKILSISIILLLLSLIFLNNNVFATVPGYENYQSSIDSLYEKVPKRSDGSYHSCIFMLNPNGTPFVFYCKSAESTSIYVENGVLKCDSGNMFHRISYKSGQFNDFGDISDLSKVEQGDWRIIDANVDITVDGELFFQIPVQEITATQELGKIMKIAGEQATLEMGQIILIIIMTTAGLMVLLVGLKKGLTVLINGFRH